MAANDEAGCLDVKEETNDDKNDLQKFDALFPSLQDDLASVWLGDKDVNDAIEWFKAVNEYNVPTGNKMRGLAVAHSFRLLVKNNCTDEELNRARILGWCIEWLVAALIVADDIMDRSLNRRGRPCWYKKAEVGVIAINDGCYLENAIYILLKKHFRSLPCYISLVEVFQEANIYDDHLHDIARSILLKLGEMIQVENDFLDCFGDVLVAGKVGNDIEEKNKITWPIVQALSLANKDQLQILKDNYGQAEIDNVNKVKDVYRQLNLIEKYKEYEETTYRNLVNMIEQLNDNNQLPKEMFYSIIRKSYKGVF